MSLLDRRTVSVLFTILVFAGALALLWVARRPFIAFLFAIFFAYLLEPLVGWFQKQRWMKGSRVRAVAATYLILLAVITIFFVTAGPHIAAEGRKLAQALPDLIDKVTSGQIAWQIGSRQGWSYETKVRAQQLLATHREQILHSAQGAASHITQIAGNVGWLVLIPILALFFLKDKSRFAPAILELVETRRERKFLKAVISDIDHMLAKYIRAQLLLAAFAMVAYTSFLLLMKFPYGFALGALGGVLEFIPFVGPLTTAAVLLGVALLTGYKHWLVLLLFLGIWRVMQDYVNAPYLMGEGLELHPLAVIFGILVGGEVGGVVGIFLSIPVIAGLRIVWRNWQQHERPTGERLQELGPRSERAA